MIYNLWSVLPSKQASSKLPDITTEDFLQSEAIYCSLLKRQQLNLKVRQMSWLLGRKSKLSLENRTLIYKCILKPIWTYGIQL
jgi:hypothetical protein